MLSSTGTSVQAAFYGANATELAEQHPAVAALLRAAGKPRNGCYKAATAELVAEANAPPHQVCKGSLLLSQCVDSVCQAMQLGCSACGMQTAVQQAFRE